MKTKIRNLIVTFFLGSFLLVSYTNCSSGFATQESLSSLSDPSAAGDPNTPPGDPGQPSTTTTTMVPNQPPPPLQPPVTDAPPLDPNALKVCPSGCDYSLPSQAMKVAKDGDVIEIQSGDYVDCLSVRKNQITVRGVGPTKPHIHGMLCDGKGIITNYGMKNRFENLELSQFSNSDYNAAAVRQDVVGKDVILSKLLIHDGQMGVLGGSAADRIRIDQTEFRHVGFLRPDGEISVPVFMTAGASLQIRASKFTDSVGGASFIKARPEKVIIDCSTIANLESEDSYSVDYQTGGKLTITNSVIEQSARTSNFTIIGINSVSFNAGITNSLTLKGNVFLNDAGRGTFVNIFRTSPSPIQIENNSFIGGGTIMSNGTALSSSNQVLSSRPASMGTYPSLPAPTSCVTTAPIF